jgi:hypothetical protein
MTPELSPTVPFSSHVSIAEPNTHPAITQALLRALPCRKDIEILLGKITKVSILCYQSRYKSREAKYMPEEQISNPSLLYPEAHPVLLARQMLLFAVALQYIPPNELIPGLTTHHHVIMERLAESAIKMVNANDVLLGTLEGLENIILESLFHIDSGNIRRGWITIRRAVMAAHLLGLHRPGHYRFKVIDGQNDLDPEVMWACIVSMERVLSLLLGLPTSTGATGSVVREETSPTAQGYNLPTVVMDVAGKILERNQVPVSQQALDMTREIDRELLRVAGHMPSTFWQPSNFAGLHMDSMDAFLETRRTMDNMFYYTLVNQLHLPYLLWPSHSHQSIYSRIACVNASRELLNREIAVRTFNPITACSRIGDFMALIAGMTLMLAHIVSHCHKEIDNLLLHQRLNDRATVERALECMKSMSELRDDVLAAKCALLLQDLLAVEADAAQGQSYRAHTLQGTNGAQGDDHNVLLINVPYVGTIKIAREGIISMLPSKSAEDRTLHDGVTIGGIGSLHVNSARLPHRETVYGTANVADPQAATARPGRWSSTDQTTAGELGVQQDQMFPDAAASMDSWVFQGFDTAFFDVLMREAGDQQLDSANTEDWGF